MPITCPNYSLNFPHLQWHLSIADIAGGCEEKWAANLSTELEGLDAGGGLPALALLRPGCWLPRAQVRHRPGFEYKSLSCFCWFQSLQSQAFKSAIRLPAPDTQITEYFAMDESPLSQIVH